MPLPTSSQPDPSTPKEVGRGKVRDGVLKSPHPIRAVVRYRSSGVWPRSVRNSNAARHASGLPAYPDIYGLLSRGPVSWDDSASQLARENCLHFGQKRIPASWKYHVSCPCVGTGQKYIRGATSLAPTCLGRTGPSFDHRSPTRIFSMDLISLGVGLEAVIATDGIPEVPVRLRHP